MRCLDRNRNDDRLRPRDTLVDSAKTPGLKVDHVANDKIQELIDKHFKFYKQINDEDKFSRYFFDWLFERDLKQAQVQHAGNVPPGS
jgi:hypothetical protein